MTARLPTAPEQKKIIAPVRGALSEEGVTVVGAALQSAVADLVDLSLVAKQAHWNLIGPRFHSIHLQLDRIADVARRHTDTIAERAAAVGVPPDGCADTVAKQSTLPVIARGWMGEDDAIAHFAAALDTAVREMRARIAATAETDPVTQDLLISVAADLEKEHWMVQATQGA